jgi:hypothetical protein
VGVDITASGRGSRSLLGRALVEGVVPLGTAGVVAVRVLGAALLAGNGWVHWHLYDLGYSTVPTIGPLFRLNAVLAALLAAAVLVTPRPWWRYACAAGALLQIGTLAGLGLSLTVGILGFRESLDAPDLLLSVVVETAGFAVLVVGALARRREREHERL